MAFGRPTHYFLAFQDGVGDTYSVMVEGCSRQGCVEHARRLRLVPDGAYCTAQALIAPHGSSPADLPCDVLMRRDRYGFLVPVERCTYPNCGCPVSFPEGHRPSVETECPRYAAVTAPIVRTAYGLRGGGRWEEPK